MFAIATRRRAVRSPGGFIEPLEARTMLSGAVSGVVYDDLNADGYRQPGDPPLAGQSVELARYVDGQRVVVATSITGADGLYTFTDVPSGTHEVRWVAAGGRFQTAPRSSATHSVDTSDRWPDDAGDFGTSLKASVSGTVFEDRDGDGTRDPGEPPAAGHVVFLDDWTTDGVRRGSEPFTTTDAAGDFRFESLYPGGHRMHLEPAAGWRRSPAVGAVDFYELDLASGGAATGKNFAVVPDLAVIGLTLVDAAADRPLRPLGHGATIDLAEVGTRLNVHADLAPELPAGSVGSVRFNFDGEADYRIEHAAPYALAGDRDRDYSIWRPTLGTHALVVTPYGGPKATGNLGRSYLMTFNVVDSTRDPAARPLRVNAGGRAYTTAPGDVFGADTGFRGGVARRDPFAVEGTDDDALYSTRRAGPRMLFSKPVRSGLYTLKLHFVEPMFAEAGRRVFDVFAEGRRVLDDYDVFADAGFRTAAVKQFPVWVAGGRLDLAFIASRDAAIVSAIELLPRPRGPARPGPALVDAGAVAGASDSLGRVFEQDGGFTGGATSTDLFDVDFDGETTSGEDALFSTHRYGPRFTFSRPLADGHYAVFLGFAEPNATAASGGRLFDVYAEGRRVVDDFDVFKKAGGARIPAAAEFDVRVTDGALDLSFAGSSATRSYRRSSSCRPTCRTWPSRTRRTPPPTPSATPAAPGTSG